MSRYGRLWEQARALRDRLRVLIPQASEVHTLAEMQAAAEIHIACIQLSLATWEEIEAAMAKEPE